jgi:hypothetical protein
VEYCVILPSGFTFFIYADFWAQALAGSFLGLYKTLRAAILGNDRSHMHVSTQTVSFWKRKFSHMSAWLPTVSGLSQKNETNQKVNWTAVINFGACKMLSNSEKSHT